MTGLDPARHVIVEIATIVTDSELVTLAEGPSFIIHPGDDALRTMSPFVRDLHVKSGLLDQIHASTVTLAEAEAATAAFVEQHCTKGTAVLAGNSVWKDREFLVSMAKTALRTKLTGEVGAPLQARRRGRRMRAP